MSKGLGLAVEITKLVRNQRPTVGGLIPVRDPLRHLQNHFHFIARARGPLQLAAWGGHSSARLLRLMLGGAFQCANNCDVCLRSFRTRIIAQSTVEGAVPARNPLQPMLFPRTQACPILSLPSFLSLSSSVSLHFSYRYPSLHLFLILVDEGEETK